MLKHAFLLLCLNAAVCIHAANPLDTIINEISWGGSLASSSDEWIELFSNSDQPIDLTGWRLIAEDGSPSIVLSGTITANGYFLLERTNDFTVSDIPADIIYTGALSNLGEGLKLLDRSSNTIDQVDFSENGWHAGSASPDYLTMERIDPLQEGTKETNWNSNDGAIRNGRDADGLFLNGTPGKLNSELES